MRHFLLIRALLVYVLSFSYTVLVGDTIAIEVFQQPSFSRTVEVAFDGTIPYPYLGNVKVVGDLSEQEGSSPNHNPFRLDRREKLFVAQPKGSDLYPTE